MNLEEKDVVVGRAEVSLIITEASWIKGQEDPPLPLGFRLTTSMLFAMPPVITKFPLSA